MINPYDDLFCLTGADGAFAPVGVVKDDDSVDLDQIMDAWFRERRESIECSLFLERAQKILIQILSDGELTPRSRRSIKSLLLAIRECRG
jgi:hypothetical protein